MRLSHQAVERPQFCALLVCMMQIHLRFTPENPASVNGGYEKRLDTMLIAPKLLSLAERYRFPARCNLGAKGCGFRGCWDTSNCRIPYATRVPVYRSRRMGYQNICRPWQSVAVTSVSRQKF